MNQINKKSIIPIFFAVDDGYAPFLGVALESMFEKASKNYFYNIHVLNNGINDEYKEMLMRLLHQRNILSTIYCGFIS